MRGTRVHHMCEDYLNNVSFVLWPDKWAEHRKHFLPWGMFQKLAHRLESIDNIRIYDNSIINYFFRDYIIILL